MANKIILKKSSIAAKAPLSTDLDFGELAINYTDSKLYFKKADGSINAFSSDVVTSVSATSPLVSSGGANPSLSIAAATASVSGYMSAAYASKLDGIASGATANTGTVTSVAGVGGYGGLTLSGTVTTSGNLTLGGTPTGSWPISVTGTSASTTGNAATATTLATARTVNGTSFNGSANITTTNWGTARTVAIGNTGKSVNGSANVSWSLSEIGAVPVSANGCVFENSQTITSNYTMTTGKNGLSAGPITIASGVVVTIPSGSFWIIS